MPLFRRCPSRRRLFAVELVTKELISSDSVHIDFSGGGGGVHSGPGFPASFDKRELIYRYKYRCKKCHHEWTEVTNKSI